jgi:hypothetical protein
VEIFIPSLHQFILAPFNNTLNFSNLHGIKTAALLQAHRVNPKLRDFIFTLNVNVQRFVPIPGVKEKSIGADLGYPPRPGLFPETAGLPLARAMAPAYLSHRLNYPRCHALHSP